MNLLVIKDKARGAEPVLRGLRDEGWIVTHAPDAETALRLTLGEAFDVILLDLMLPDLPVGDFCSKLRARGDHTPILVVSALDSTDARSEALCIGADDFTVMPFDFDELIAVIEALARRPS